MTRPDQLVQAFTLARGARPRRKTSHVGLEKGSRGFMQGCEDRRNHGSAPPPPRQAQEDPAGPSKPSSPQDGARNPLQQDGATRDKGGGPRKGLRGHPTEASQIRRGSELIREDSRQGSPSPPHTQGPHTQRQSAHCQAHNIGQGSEGETEEPKNEDQTGGTQPTDTVGHSWERG